MGKDNENENAASVLTTRNNVITQVVTDDDDDFEIDFMELFFMFRQHLLMLILAFLVGGGLGYAVSKFVLTPTYTSTSMIYVMSKETTLTSLADLQIGSQLTEDYKVLVTSRTVMEDVIKKLSLDMDYYDLRNKITLDNPNNTRILNISVLDTDPQRAKRLTDAVADSASDYIADIMEQDPPKIIEYGEIPLRKTGPKTGRNAIIMAVVFELIAMAGLTISMLTNDTIRSEDDIKKYFNIPVLAEIPEIDPEAAKKASRYSYDYARHDEDDTDDKKSSGKGSGHSHSGKASDRSAGDRHEHAHQSAQHGETASKYSTHVSHEGRYVTDSVGANGSAGLAGDVKTSSIGTSASTANTTDDGRMKEALATDGYRNPIPPRTPGMSRKRNAGKEGEKA